MKQKLSIIQPYIHLSLKGATDKEFTSPAGMHMYDVTDLTKLPDSLDIIPSASCVWIIAYNSPSQSRFICIGSQSKKITVDIGNFKKCFVVVFDDNAVYFNKSASDTLAPSNLAEQIMDFKPDRKCPEYAFISQLCKSDNSDDRFNAFKDYLASSKRHYDFGEDMTNMRSLITNADGDCHVSYLSEQTGYSCRHINRRFNAVYGFGPKELCVRIRFQHALKEMFNDPNRQNSEFIQNIGYSDQAHFQREFKTFMGETPKQFVKKLKS